MMLGRERKDAAGALIVANVLEGFANLFAVGAAIREGDLGQIDGIISLRHELVGSAVEATLEALGQGRNLRLHRIGVGQLVADHELLAQ